MSKRYPGGLLSTTGVREPSATNQSSNSGIWTLEEQNQAEGSGTWANPSGQVYEISRSLKFRQNGSTYLTRTPTTTGSRTTWTYSVWAKRTTLNSDGFLLYATDTGNDGNNHTFLQWFGDKLRFAGNLAGTTNVDIRTTAEYRDVSAWYHIVLNWNSTASSAKDRARLYVNGIEVISFSAQTLPSQNALLNINLSGYPHRIGWYSGTSFYLDGYLAETNFIDGQALTPEYFGYFDYNGVWQPKKYTGDYGINGFYLPFNDSSSVLSLGRNFALPSNLVLNSEDLTSANWSKRNTTITSNNTTAPNGTNTADKVVSNTTNGDHSVHQSFGTSLALGGRYTWSVYAKAAEYDKIYFYYSSYNSGPYPEFNLTNKTATNGGILEQLPNGWFRCSHTFTIENTASNSIEIYINSLSPYVGNNTSGLFLWGAQLNLGDSLDAYLPTSTAINNNWTPTNFIVTPGSSALDSLRDSPTNGSITQDTGVGGQVSGNYATLNNLYRGYGVYTAASTTITNGNLNQLGNASGNNCIATMAIPTTGKWYFEMTVGAVGNGSFFPGLINESGSLRYYENTGTYYNGSSSVAYGASYTLDNVIGVAVDSDALSLTFYKNGVSQGTISNAFTFTPGTNWYPWFYTSSNSSISVNFGQRTFNNTAPAGFKCLNSANLPMPSLPNGKLQFDVVRYSGNDENFRKIPLDFSPGLVWIKARTSTQPHILQNSSIGGGGLELSSNSAAAEGATSGGVYGNVRSFDSDGFTLLSGSSNNAYTNLTGQNYISWNWKGGSTAVTNTDGNITSTVRVNREAGFSIVTYIGNGSASLTGIGHGLNMTPRFYIIKNRGGTTNWFTFHRDLNNQGIWLNGTGGAFANSAFFSSYPNETNIFVSTDTSVNANGNGHVAFVWAEVPGFSKFGSYVANASSDGPFIYTGFRPAFLLIKNLSRATNWTIFDNRRSTAVGSNVISNYLLPNTSAAEANGDSTEGLDFLATGIKIRGVSTSYNNHTAGDIYIYAAFAEHPFKIARAR